MSWATEHIKDLKAGKTIKIRPTGGSMAGIIESGQLCTIAPITDEIKADDVVLCEIDGKQYLHLVKERFTITEETAGMDTSYFEYLIGNNRGGLNGIIDSRTIYGKLINVEP